MNLKIQNNKHFFLSNEMKCAKSSPSCLAPDFQVCSISDSCYAVKRLAETILESSVSLESLFTLSLCTW